MKKSLYILVLAILATGCGKKEQKIETNVEDTFVADAEAETEEEEMFEETEEEISEEPQKDYITSAKEQADAIRSSLEEEVLTQTDMNVKAQELYEIWDEVLNCLWGELKNTLPEEELEILLDEQRTWIAEKEKAIEEVGKEVEGGSMYSLIVNTEAARITEERVYELYEFLK